MTSSSSLSKGSCCANKLQLRSSMNPASRALLMLLIKLFFHVFFSLVRLLAELYIFINCLQTRDNTGKHNRNKQELIAAKRIFHRVKVDWYESSRGGVHQIPMTIKLETRK
jgi:hypothetical protein